MARTKHTSTSSEPTGGSEGWTEIAALGSRIVAELGPDHELDTLSRWMAHRVAELITRATAAESTEAERLRTEASSTILELWAHRNVWPRGWQVSPINIERVLERRSSGPWRTPDVPERVTWLEAYGILREFHQLEDEAWRERALAEYPAEEADAWLAEHGQSMDEEERETIQRLLEAARRAQRGMGRATVPPGLVDRGEEEADDELDKRIKELEYKRRELRDSIVAGWPVAGAADAAQPGPSEQSEELDGQ